MPVRKQPSSKQTDDAVWADFDRLAAEIGAYLPEQVDAVEAINEIRREF